MDGAGRMSLVNEGPGMRVGSWVSVEATGRLNGVLMEDAGAGMLVVQVVVGEWMVSPAEPAAIEDGAQRVSAPPV
jgi:hypothetical protein